MLTRLSHTVTTAENGLVALRAVLAGDQKFDLVFLDNQMPEMTGVEMAREVRRRGIDIFLCGVTGNALKEDQ
jgi:CheY-like chemotaxis protein